MAVPMRMTLFVTITVHPKDHDEFLKALRPCWQGCIQEPECIYFDVFHSSDNPGTFRFVEVWTENREWFKTVQLNRSYYEPYLSITKPMWVKDREMVYLDRVPNWNFVDKRYLDGSIKQE